MIALRDEISIIKRDSRFMKLGSDRKYPSQGYTKPLYSDSAWARGGGVRDPKVARRSTDLEDCRVLFASLDKLF